MSDSEQTQIISTADISALIKRAEDGLLTTADAPLVINLSRLVLELLIAIDDKQLSIAQLKQMLFGQKSEKRRNLKKAANPPVKNNTAGNEDAAAPENVCEATGTLSLAESSLAQEQQTIPDGEKKKRQGHGRLGVADFTGAQVIVCAHSQLRPFDKCPHEHCQGHLYDPQEAKVLIKREARPLIDATIFERQVLRCAKCRDRFTASLPPDVSEEKFEASADVMIAIAHYGYALPFYRLARMQSDMGVPLPAATQFERTELVADTAHPVFLELKREAAKSGLLHTDDTTARILSLIKENKELTDDDRKGMFTTGIGARTAEFDIVLYVSGRQYSSENLAELMLKRPDDLTEFILMADAEKKNWSKKFSAIVAKCLVHGRRQFVNCEPAFRKECGVILDKIGEVYKIDAQTKDMTPQERLAHHQQFSQPIMDSLKQYMDDLIKVEKKEPNSALGKAIKYMNTHWMHLTQFLRTAGCPLDNNFIERCLRNAVILRKNSLFFKTEHGANIFDVLASIIGTCNLNNINPFEYLITLMKNKKDVRAHPADWLPWNYQKMREAA